MGGRSWSDDDHVQRAKHRVDTGAPVFPHHVAMAAAAPKDRKAHDSLNPMLLNKAGKKIRESRDSDAQPESLPIAVFLDVTGSMNLVPPTIQAALPKLMGMIQRKGVILHPHILIGGIGDTNCDHVPLQVGQFESDIKIEDDLTNLYLEGGGGGQKHESYGLGLYFLQRYAVTDSWEKRQKKGYIVVIGDELPYPNVGRREVEQWMGDTIEANISIEEIVADLQKRWELFYIQPNMTQYYERADVLDPWRKLFGTENVLLLDKPEGISEMIASTLTLCESGDLTGAIDAMKDTGTDLAVVGAVENALAPLAKARARQGAQLQVAGSGAGSGVDSL